MPECIGDMFRFDIAGTPCPIVHGGDRGGGRSGEVSEVVHQPEERFHRAEIWVTQIPDSEFCDVVKEA